MPFVYSDVPMAPATATSPRMPLRRPRPAPGPRVYPVLVGGGIPYFPQRDRRVDLELVENRTEH
jgi:hypothetical protein